MADLIFITHPEVVIDPEGPVTGWRLSGKGRARMARFAAGPEAAGIAAIWSSAETKARESAGILARARRLAHGVDADLGENDRSATGYLPPPAFEAAADAFFAHPRDSVNGWEPAADAQARILAALRRIAATADTGAGDLAIVSHGAVGTLALCALDGRPIDRVFDQPGQGHFWRARLPALTMLHGWRPL